MVKIKKELISLVMGIFILAIIFRSFNQSSEVEIIIPQFEKFSFEKNQFSDGIRDYRRYKCNSVKR